MKKLPLAAAISTLIATQAFAANYVGTATSGTAASPLASVVVSAGAPTFVYYVDPTSGTASNKTHPAIQVVKASNWTFDFTNPAAVSFTGAIVMGDYKTQTYVNMPTPNIPVIDGRQTYTGVTTSLSGVGSYNDATNTFTFNYFNATVNGGGGSTYSETATATCANGVTSALGQVCRSFTQATKPWEGLALNFVFSEDKSSFAGTLQGTDTSGSGISRNTTLINWQIQAVPVPAAAWLFGSGLIGLAGISRRRARKE